MNPASRDSDGDGLADDVDATPLHAPRASEVSDEEAQVLRRAWLAMYGVRGSRYAHFVPKGFRSLQLEGLAAPVFFNVDLPSRAGCGRGTRTDCSPIRGGVETTWRMSKGSGAIVIVEFTNYMGSGFMSSALVRLRKLNDAWIVVEYVRGRVT